MMYEPVEFVNDNFFQVVYGDKKEMFQTLNECRRFIKKENLQDYEIQQLYINKIKHIKRSLDGEEVKG